MNTSTFGLMPVGLESAKAAWRRQTYENAARQATEDAAAAEKKARETETYYQNKFLPDVRKRIQAAHYAGCWSAVVRESEDAGDIKFWLKRLKAEPEFATLGIYFVKRRSCKNCCLLARWRSWWKFWLE